MVTGYKSVFAESAATACQIVEKLLYEYWSHGVQRCGSQNECDSKRFSLSATAEIALINGRATWVVAEIREVLNICVRQSGRYIALQAKKRPLARKREVSNS